MCIGCYDVYEKHATVCHLADFVCKDKIGTHTREVAITCQCKRLVCQKCYPIDEFRKVGLCTICLEKDKIKDEVKADEGRAAKRAKVEDCD